MKSISTVGFWSIMFIMLVPSIALCSQTSIVWTAERAELKDMVLAGHSPIQSYRDAREHLFGDIHLRRDKDGHYVRDVYCHDIIRTKVGPMRIPDARVINTEHTWPKSRFNKRMPYNYQLTDLHHLYPTNSQANGRRGNYHFTELPNESGPVQHGCNDSHLGRIQGTGKDGFEPPAEHKGNVARALFYFSIRYDIPIKEYEEVHLRMWHVSDPVDQDEIRRNDIVERAQGNRNPFIDRPELVSRINNF